MKVLNVLTKKEEDIKKEDLICNIKRSDDFIISVPHSGLLIPKKYVSYFDISKAMLTGSDLYTDLLYDFEKGIKIVTRINNYLLNMNRFREKVDDPELPGHLQRDPFHGRGLMGEQITKKELSEADKKELLKYYDLYHSMIHDQLSEMKKNKGYALMFDCHSMMSVSLNPSLPKKERADFVIGTLKGKSAHPAIIAVFIKKLKEGCIASGWTVEQDYPFMGGAITRKHSDVKNNISVIQIETKRKLFHDECIGGGEGFKLDRKKLSRVNKVVYSAILAASEAAKKLFI